MIVRGILVTLAGLTIGSVRPLALPGASSAPPGLPLVQEQEMNFTVDGKITEHTLGKLTINTEGNMLFHVVYSDKTEIKRKDGAAGTSQDLQVGTRIHVDGELTESGTIIAKRIEVSPQRDSKK